jgi:hypothetical protein
MPCVVYLKRVVRRSVVVLQLLKNLSNNLRQTHRSRTAADTAIAALRQSLDFSTLVDQHVMTMLFISHGGFSAYHAHLSSTATSR